MASIAQDDSRTAEAAEMLLGFDITDSTARRASDFAKLEARWSTAADSKSLVGKLPPQKTTALYVTETGEPNFDNYFITPAKKWPGNNHPKNLAAQKIMAFDDRMYRYFRVLKCSINVPLAGVSHRHRLALAAKAELEKISATAGISKLRTSPRQSKGSQTALAKKASDHLAAQECELVNKTTLLPGLGLLEALLEDSTLLTKDYTPPAVRCLLTMPHSPAELGLAPSDSRLEIGIHLSGLWSF